MFQPIITINICKKLIGEKSENFFFSHKLKNKSWYKKIDLVCIILKLI